MCDDVEEIDEFIEYELTKDCDPVEETFIYEEEDEDGVVVDAELLEDIKPDMIIMEVIEEDDIDQEYYDGADGFVEEVSEEMPLEVEYVKEEETEQKPNLENLNSNVETANVLLEEKLNTHEEILSINDDQILSTNSEEVLSTNQEHFNTSKEQVTTTNAPLKGPMRYLLFDELVANIVDYDKDDTPIVEFSLSNTEQDEKLPVECGICPDVMHKSKLSSHLKTHLVAGTNRFACIYCDKVYKDHSYLAGHARRHMGIRPYVCEPCKLYFSTKQDLRVHNQRRHQEKEHICEVCGKTFAQNTMLKRHRESTHEKMRRFQCEHCPKAYYKNFSLTEHVRNVHMGNRRMLVCPFCGMQCRDAHKMARHRKLLHLNQKYFLCDICQEEFTDISYFDAHKRSIQCRNNTQRKLEEEQLLAERQQEEQQELLAEQTQVNDNHQQHHHQIIHVVAEEEVEQKHIQFVTHHQTAHQLQLQPQHTDDDLCYEITVVNTD
ncbi:uncharacterized protein [Eurosta solidaginis]|uniref:uncharacterized protein n=1 Tax=Eurosta solidaginis TaxID=178769 RepID=UPI0035311495